jgi:hypothetical protein
LGLEQKKEQARKRAKAVHESSIYAKKKHERSITPGVRIVGSGLLGGERELAEPERTDMTKQVVLAYVVNHGGFEVSDEHLVERISKKSDSEDVMEVRIARIKGLHEKWGLDRRFISRSIYAHRLENGAIIEYSLLSYGGFESRTYYIVVENNFRSFAQWNFRKAGD